MASAGKGAVSVVSADMLRTIKGDIEKTGKTSNREAGILAAAEIERMKRSAKYMTKEQTIAHKKIQDEQKQQ